MIIIFYFLLSLTYILPFLYIKYPKGNWWLISLYEWGIFNISLLYPNLFFLSTLSISISQIGPELPLDSVLKHKKAPMSPCIFSYILTTFH
jgi:hypothetical protein